MRMALANFQCRLQADDAAANDDEIGIEHGILFPVTDLHVVSCFVFMMPANPLQCGRRVPRQRAAAPGIVLRQPEFALR